MARVVKRWTEETVQQVMIPNLLYKGYDCVCPNVFINGWEADVLALNRSGYLCEYEIKVSRSDFRADFKKEAKHGALVDGWSKAPNYFSYVCPKGLIRPDEVPSYAGLIWVDKMGSAQTVKKPPLIHKTKCPEKQERRLWRNMNFRLWRMAYAPPGWTPPKKSRRRGKRRSSSTSRTRGSRSK